MQACHCKSTSSTLLPLDEVINMCWLMSKGELNHKCAPGSQAGGLAASLALSVWRDSSHGPASFFFWWFLKDFTLSSFVYERAFLSFPLVLPPPWHSQDRVITYKGILLEWNNGVVHSINKTKQNKMFPITAIYRHVTPWLLMGSVCSFPMGVPKFLAPSHRHKKAWSFSFPS